MTNRDELLRQCERFLTMYGGIIGTALDKYARDMREASSDAVETYNEIKDDPERRAAQDKTRITTNGFLMFSEIFTDNAVKAEKASAALVELTEIDVEEDGDEVPDDQDMESMYPRDREDGEGLNLPSYGD